MQEMPASCAIYKGATREKVRRALVRVLEGDEQRVSTAVVTIRTLRQAGTSDQNCTAEMLRLWRAGSVSVVDSWDDPRRGELRADPPPVAPPASPTSTARPGLGARVRSARTDADREGILHELAALVAEGGIAPDEAAQVRAALAEARQAAEKSREVAPVPEEAERMLMVGEAEALAARSLFLMVSDERRARLFALVAAEALVDAAENPNVDALGGGR